MRKTFLTLVGVHALGVVLAQSPPITGTSYSRNIYQGRNLHATTSIELQPGFVVNENFQARIVPPATTHGSWTDPKPWTVPGSPPYFGFRW